MGIALIGFIILIASLVLVHEWGHFWVARKLKIKVEEFGFGFPPRLFGIRKKGIFYSFNLFPIGGFVRIFGEQGEGAGSPYSFISRPAWQRFMVIVAGVFMNLVLAWAFFSFGSFLGVPAALDDDSAGANVRDVAITVIDVAPESPAGRAGVQFGDIVLGLAVGDDEKTVETVDDIQEFTAGHLGMDMTIAVRRGGQDLMFTVVPRQHPPEGEGPVGVALSRVGILQVPWYKALWVGLQQTWFSLTSVVIGMVALFTDLFSTGKISADVSGPVGIFRVAGQAWALGLSYFLQLAAVLSVNLAVLNALPFPALDGGRILFLAIEKIRGSRVDQKMEHMAHAVGFILLIVLMVAITYRDIVKLF